MSDYLSAEELADLVNCKKNQRAVMRGWLEENHWRFVLDKTGLPKVARAYRDKKLGVSDEKTSKKHSDTPNFPAFA